MKITVLKTFVVLSLFSLMGCYAEKTAKAPLPTDLTGEENGYFCGMTITGHPGPKAQIHVVGEAEPLWFSQVRDMFGFIMLPGESQKVTALYVSDMSKAPSWTETDGNFWMDPQEAWFVINSERKGGMGALEVIPFSVKADAEQFVTDFGGQVITFDEVSPEYVFDTTR